MPDGPAVECMLVGDQVIHDSMSRKWSVVGVYNQVMCQELPVMHRGLGVFVSLSDVYRPIQIMVRITDPDGGKMFEADGNILPNRGGHGFEQFGINIMWLQLTREGRHAVQLLHQDHIMGETQFKVLMVKAGGRT